MKPREIHFECENRFLVYGYACVWILLLLVVYYLWSGKILLQKLVTVWEKLYWIRKFFCNLWTHIRIVVFFALNGNELKPREIHFECEKSLFGSWIWLHLNFAACVVAVEMFVNWDKLPQELVTIWAPVWLWFDGTWAWFWVADGWGIRYWCTI